MPSPESKHPVKIAATVLLVALAYFITGWLGLFVFAVVPKVTLIWLPAGIALAAGVVAWMRLRPLVKAA